jgi:hypothetical protein
MAEAKCQYMGNSHMVGSCTKDAVGGKSYCTDHLHIVYQKGTARAKRHKEVRVVNNIRMWESLFNEAVEQLEAEGEFSSVAPVDVDTLTF